MAGLRTVFLSSSLRSYPAFCSSRSNSELCRNDPRVVRLAVLLRDLEKALHEVEPIPDFELCEIVSGAIELFGFTDPVETQNVISAVLDALKGHDTIPATPSFWVNSGQPS